MIIRFVIKLQFGSEISVDLQLRLSDVNLHVCCRESGK